MDNVVEFSGTANGGSGGNLPDTQQQQYSYSLGLPNQPASVPGAAAAGTAHHLGTTNVARIVQGFEHYEPMDTRPLLETVPAQGEGPPPNGCPPPVTSPQSPAPNPQQLYPHLWSTQTPPPATPASSAQTPSLPAQGTPQHVLKDSGTWIQPAQVVSTERGTQTVDKGACPCSRPDTPAAPPPVPAAATTPYVPNNYAPLQGPPDVKSSRTPKEVPEEKRQEMIPPQLSNGGRRLIGSLQDLDKLRRYKHFNPPDFTMHSQTVLVDLQRGVKAPYMPYPRESQSRGPAWDGDHVRMPYAKECKFPVQQRTWFGRKRGGEDTKLENKWDLIIDALTGSKISSSGDLADAILKYNAGDKFDFSGLHQFFRNVLSPSESGHFFRNTLPAIKEACFGVQSQITQPIPLLKVGQNRSVTMSQRQIFALLANAFLCTFPRRNPVPSDRNHEYANYPTINFNQLYADFRRASNPEKVKCILNYFDRMAKRKDGDATLVTFERRALTNFPRWDASKVTLSDLVATPEGSIEDHGRGMLQVDFANSLVGGGVIGNGSVQEEIRFSISPELIAARLFAERLADNECLVVTGFERFSDYSGYSDSFKYVGSRKDDTPVDQLSGHKVVKMVAMDAMRFRDRESQYEKENILRELNKAYVGFDTSKEPPGQVKAAVATGNWGCGAFGGDPHLKGLLQLMAASVAGRQVAYFTFGDRKLAEDLQEMHAFLAERKIPVGKLFDALVAYRARMPSKYGYGGYGYGQSRGHQALFPYLREALSGGNKRTTSNF